MVSNDEKRVDPTVKTIAEMFPEEFLRNTARETGVVMRARKIDPVILFWWYIHYNPTSIIISTQVIDITSATFPK